MNTRLHTTNNSKLDLRIETGQFDVSKLDINLKGSDNLHQRKSSMVSNEMAKDMLKGDFEDSLQLLDRAYSSKLH